MKKEERMEWIERFISEQAKDPEAAAIWRSKLRKKYKIPEEYELWEKYTGIQQYQADGLKISWYIPALKFKKHMWAAETSIKGIVLHRSCAKNQWIGEEGLPFPLRAPMDAGKKDHLCNLSQILVENDYLYKVSAMGQINDLFSEALKMCYDGQDYGERELAHSYIKVEYERTPRRPLNLEQFSTLDLLHTGKYLKSYMDKHGNGCNIILDVIKNEKIADYIDPDSNLFGHPLRKEFIRGQRARVVRIVD